MSNPTQSVTVTVVVESGTTPAERALTRAQTCYTLTGSHAELMVGFKRHTTPGIITALATSMAMLEGLELEQEPPPSAQPPRELAAAG